MRLEGRFLSTLVAAGVLGIGIGSAQAALFDDQYSLTQPAAELVMPFDARDGKATFLLVSNPAAKSGSVPQISTHWIFWGTNGSELANVSMCLTLNDTIVVDPTNFSSVGADNSALGPKVNLSGQRGIVTVVAYETDEDCRAFEATGERLLDNAIVGSFTIADADEGYSFGNDAMGLFLAGDKVRLPDGSDVDRYALQSFDPEIEEVQSLVVLSHLIETSTIVVPSGSQTFFANFYDNTEANTSLPDISVGAVTFRVIKSREGNPDAALIPDFVVVGSSGIVAMTPTPRMDDQEYIFGISGQALGSFGASSRIKVDLCDPLQGCTI